MLTVRTVARLRSELSARRVQALRHGKPLRVGLVPTMGALHDGHLSLIRRAAAACDVVVVSLFVNPRQFNDAGDLAGYPRDVARDQELAAAAGADVLFAPSVQDVYPDGFATTVSVGGPSEPLEGVHRGPGHFQGVATVVAKLLNMVGPEVAYFGHKDAQQAVVIRRMVADLDIPTEIALGPTVRDRDGLALSSRNALLTASQRRRAPVLHQALLTVAQAVRDGQRDPAAATANARRMVTDAGLELEYLELVDPDTMASVSWVDGDSLALVAARLGQVRLIDNELIPLTMTTEPMTASPSDTVTATRST